MRGDYDDDDGNDGQGNSEQDSATRGLTNMRHEAIVDYLCGL